MRLLSYQNYEEKPLNEATVTLAIIAASLLGLGIARRIVQNYKRKKRMRKGIEKLQKQVDALERKKESYIEGNDFAKAKRTHQDIVEIRSEIAELREDEDDIDMEILNDRQTADRKSEEFLNKFDGDKIKKAFDEARAAKYKLRNLR